MTDEELVAQMADTIFRLRSANRDVKSSDLARAALAVAEPVIRERCAVECDQLRHPDWSQESDDWCAGTAACANALRFPIRTGGTP